MIEACGLYEELNNSSLLQDLIMKLPSDLQLGWGMFKTELTKENKKTNLSAFADWLFDVGVSASSVNVRAGSTKTANTEQFARNKLKNAYIHTHSEQKHCLVCDDDCKNVSNCKKFLSADRNERWNIIRECKLCKLCLHKHFGFCKSNIVCGLNNCNIKHNPLLHKAEDKFLKEIATNHSKKNKNETHNVNAHRGMFNEILFKILPITIFGPNNKYIQTFAFIDEGSSISLVNEKLINELNLEGEVQPLCLKWTNNVQRYEESSKKLAIKLAGPNNKKHLIEVRSVKHLTLPSQSIDYPKLSAAFPHIRKLPIASYQNAIPEVLIGLNNINLCISNCTKEGGIEEPTAIRTRLGWVLFGNVGSKTYNEYFTGVHVCECNDSKLNNLVKQFYTLETTGITGRPSVLGKEDMRAIEMLEKHTVQKPCGRYETALLWRCDNLQLPESYTMAKKRLICLEKTIQKNNDLFKIFEKTIKEYIEKGYITKLCNIQHEERVWYLPIFPVFNKNKPNKTKIVWDAAAKSHGVSLNSTLLKGPDLLVSLPSVFFQFRQKQVAFASDIEQMFHRIFIREEDRHAQRFLWRSCDATREPDVYIMNVLIFGASCSPCISQYVKNFNAAKYKNKYPEAANAIQNNHYVDDFLFSTDTYEDAVKLATEVHHIHSSAGFNLRNWISNNSALLKYLNGSNINDKNLNIGDDQNVEKVLGIFWKSNPDIITFKMSNSIINSDLVLGMKPPTKRQILKILMSVYDPLGLLGHFLMYLKIIMQEIWRSGVGWDEPILSLQTEKWEKWLSVLPEIKDIKIPRCYLHNIPNYSDVTTELHTFVDASENGYAAVAYLRIRSATNVVISLVGSKTRVAPLKLVSIPRLELMAALIGSRFAKNIVENHTIHINKKVFWSDSRTVLSWIRSDHRKYHQFVAVRISEILDLTKINEWRWIAGKDNVADDATKWATNCDLSESSRWFNGPNFLRLAEDLWPADKKDTVSTEIEMKHSILAVKVVPTFINIKRFSQWNRLLRTVAYVIKFCEILKNKLQRNQLAIELTHNELKLAEILILKETQSQYFLEEIRDLKQGKVISAASSLYKLSPFLDESQILRINGRIDNANILPETKNPAILPKNSYITELIILHYHRRFHHIHNETVINELRQKYYIPQLRIIFKSVLKRCQMCKIKKAIPKIPQMAKLPQARLSSYIAPFTFTGLDYFGPMYVLVNRHKEKRYGALFTCLTIRAVHIEIVHTLNTSSCIMAIRNFAARRGTPREFLVTMAPTSLAQNVN